MWICVNLPSLSFNSEKFSQLLENSNATAAVLSAQLASRVKTQLAVFQQGELYAMARSAFAEDAGFYQVALHILCVNPGDLAGPSARDNFVLH